MSEKSDDSSIDPESSLYNTCRDESSYTNSDIKIYDDINEFDKNLPSTVTLLRNQFGSKIYIVGTAHFSKESQDDVSRVIRNVKPDVVMVELCAARIHMLNHDEKTLLEEARDMNFSKIRNITKSNGLLNGLFYVLMLKMSANITRDLGMAPGGEFRRAVQEMKMLANPAICHLGDRAIHITLQRALNGLSTWQTLKIAFKLVFCNNTITKEEVEKCKQKDILEELLEQMADEYPVFRNVFVTERDLYLCHSLTVAALPKADETGTAKPVNVVGVVGIGHMLGIKNNWGKVDESQLIEILSIPSSKPKAVIKTTIKCIGIVLLCFTIFKVVRR